VASPSTTCWPWTWCWPTDVSSRPSAKDNPDLFWAVRGGGGNFGVVTAFTFKAHDVHTNYAGPTLYPLEDSAEVLRCTSKFIVKAPNELNGSSRS